MKISKVILLIVFCIIVVNFMISPISYALDNPTSIITDANGFLDKATEGKLNADDIKGVSDAIYNILLVIATIMAVAILSILAIRYMMESAEGKADIKQSIIPFIVGCVVVFGAFAIWKIVMLIAANF